MDDVELPPLARVQHDYRSSDLPLFNSKRSRSEYDLTTSSDPALFSSDDHVPSAENYSIKRRKQEWKGTWWGERLADPNINGKRTFTRNFDSGVFMGSEGTDSDLEDELLEDQRSQNAAHDARQYGTKKRGSFHPDACQDLYDKEDLATRDLPTVVAETLHVLPTSAHNEARVIVQKCLEDGNEDVNLSSLSLESLPPEILRPLHSLTKHSSIHDVPASQEAFSSLEANMRLYLANNSLQTLPLVLFDFGNLRLLSLRHNSLTELPPAIGRLKKLEHLNVANNKLQCLPYEAIELVRDGKLMTLISLDNPWRVYGDEQVCAEMQFLVEDFEFRCNEDSRTLLVAKAPRMDLEGNGQGLADQSERRNASDPSESLQTSSPVKSLLSLALLQCSRTEEISQLPDVLADEVPSHIHDLLTLARKVREIGGRTCSICQRAFVVPRRQWVEWWARGSILTHQKDRFGYGEQCTKAGLPVLRQQCTLGCVARVKA